MNIYKTAFYSHSLFFDFGDDKHWQDKTSINKFYRPNKLQLQQIIIYINDLLANYSQMNLFGYKMSEVSRCLLCLSNRQSRTQRYLVYYHV